MKTFVLVFLIAFVVAVASAFAAPKTFQQTARRFDGHHVLRVKFTQATQIKQFNALLGNKEIDVWSNDGLLQPVVDNDVLLSQEDARKVMKEFCGQNGVTCKVLSSNFQSALDEHQNQILAARANADDFFTNYHTFEDNIAYTKQIAAKYPQMAELVEIGRSLENRTMLGVRVHAPGASTGKNATYIEGTIHAREWIATPVVQYALTQLLSAYGQDKRVTDILNAMDVVLMPVTNPDGFSYTWNGDRLWRKNRRPNSGSKYYGVDINRNFPEGYGIGASSSPSSETYKGTAPLSEPEAQALNAYLKAHPEFRAGIDFHSYSQLLLRGYGYKDDVAPGEKRLNALGARMQGTIQKQHNVLYQNVKGVDLYPAGGAFDDFMLEIMKMDSVYTIELRDTGRYGFLLPPEQIKPTVDEIWNGLLVFFEGVIAHMRGQE